jgi:ATP-dependent helicase Lhr and Lhr-like helicase
LLQRIHKRTLGALRKQIEPVTPAVYMRWLLQWQHVAPQAQLTGEQGVLEAIRGLEGFEAPAIEWERSLLPQRVSGYDPRWLDSLCMSGVVGWGRVSPHPAFDSVETGGTKSRARRIVPTSMAPVAFFIREEARWMELCLQQRQIPHATLDACLTELAGKLRFFLAERGAMFSGDLARSFAVPAADLQRALWELVAAGLVTADGFDSLRVLIDPKRKSTFGTSSSAKPRGRVGHAAGRWSLLSGDSLATSPAQREEQLESACTVLLRRYGVVFRDLLAREETMPRWRDLLGIFRRMEARGEVRGGRFLSGFGGEQFALPDAVESLREMRRRPDSAGEVTVAAADPLNLVEIVVPGERVAAVPGKTVTFLNGAASGHLPNAAGSNDPPLASDEVVVSGLFPATPGILKQSGMERAGV